MRATVALLLLLLSATTVFGDDLTELRPSYLAGKEDRLEILVNVWGEVTRPGSYRVPDDTDLIGLLSIAGGPTEDANLNAVKVVRVRDSARDLMRVRLEDILEHPDRLELPTLMPGDTVRVGRRARRTWKGALRTFSEIAVIASTYVFIADRLD
ncbi:MAG: polysaccharide biosynthesis/export family protein [Candidatus Krumholzibacteriia bacterium]